MRPALLAAALLLAPAARAALPLPGYAPGQMKAPPARMGTPLPGYAAGEHSEAFPSSARFFGGAEDPLDTLAVGGEDLRDAMAAPPGLAQLRYGLRSRLESDRLAAIRAAGRPRDVSSVPHLTGALLRLDEPSSIRAAAALALGRIADRVAVPALAEALKDPVPDVRYAAALALGRLPADGVATRLEHVLKGDPSWQVRYAAAIALGRTKKTFAAQALAKALADDASWQVRQQSARSLQDLPTERSAQALAAALRDPEPSVRAAAGTALAEVGGPAQHREIANALASETEPSVKAMLALAARRALQLP